MGNEYVQLLLFHVTTFTVLLNKQFALQLDKIILLNVVTLFFWTLVLIAILYTPLGNSLLQARLWGFNTPRLFLLLTIVKVYWRGPKPGLHISRKDRMFAIMFFELFRYDLVAMSL